MWEVLCELIRAAVRLPSLEPEFSSPWPADVREILPSASPNVVATAVWGPVLAWCVLRALALGFDRDAPQDAALRAFDWMRLREPLARSFSQSGFEGEDSWRAAARVRSAFLAEASGPKRIAGYPPQLWEDPDAQWLIGLHEAADLQMGRTRYFNREQHEQLLWWIQLPVLVKRLSAENETALPAPEEAKAKSAPEKPAASAALHKTKRRSSVIAKSPTSPVEVSVKVLERELQGALAEARKAGYRMEEIEKLEESRVC
jgi:hypothetical protein